MQHIPNPWLEGQNHQSLEVFDCIFNNLISIQKIPRYAYSILFEECIPDKRICFWKNLYNDPEDLDWEEIHFRNFKGTSVFS